MLLCHLCFSLSSWDEYYKDTSKPDETTIGTSESPEKSQYYTSELTAYIYNSMFYGCSASDGGAIFYDTKDGKILIEFTTFGSCKASNQYGGAVYIKNCSCVINCVCCSMCSSQLYGMAFRTELVNGNINYVHQTTVSSCRVIGNNDYGATVDILYGEQQCHLVSIH